MSRIEQNYARPPWVVDIDLGSPDVDMQSQADQLLANAGTSAGWCAVGICDTDGFAEVVALAHPDNARRIVQCVNAHDALIGALKDIIGDGIDVVEQDCGGTTGTGQFVCRHCGREWSAARGDDEVPELCPDEECPGHIARKALADAMAPAQLPRGSMSDKKLQAFVTERRTLEIELAELKARRSSAYALFKTDDSTEAQLLYFRLGDEIHEKTARYHTVRKLVADEMLLRHPPGTLTFAKVLRAVLKEKGHEDLFKEAQRRWDETKV